MAHVLDEDELIGNWTLVGDELEQLSGRRGATKLGSALLLRFYAVHGRFPAGRGEIPDQVTGVDVFAAIRDEPGNVSVKTIGQETFKLGAIRAVGLSDDLFADVAPKVLAGWRARVAAEGPSHLRSHPPLDAVPEPRNLRRLKTAIRARWGVVPLMDMLTRWSRERCGTARTWRSSRTSSTPTAPALCGHVKVGCADCTCGQ